MKYEDEHRIFLQGLMSRGILNTEEVNSLFKTAYNRCQVAIPPGRQEFGHTLVKFIQCINKELEFMNLAIVKTLDENSRQREPYYVLVNRMDRSEDSTQLTKKSMVDFSQHELEYLKLLIAAVMESPDRQISTIDAINLCKQVKSKSVKSHEGEAAVNKLVLNGWLKRADDGSIRFSQRLIAEMEIYLKDVHRDSAELCKMCNKLVVRAISCPGCEASYHLYCLSSQAGSKEAASAASATCKMCMDQIDFADDPIHGGRQGNKSGGGNKSGRKRAHQTTVIESSSDESD